MPERSVIVSAGENVFAIPFSFVEEIVGTEKVVRSEDMPEDAVDDKSRSAYWVVGRNGWSPLGKIVPESRYTERSQIVIAGTGGQSRAFIVDQIIGMEVLSESMPFPETAAPYVSLPYKGVHLWRGQVVLELDLSRLI